MFYRVESWRFSAVLVIGGLGRFRSEWSSFSVVLRLYVILDSATSGGTRVFHVLVSSRPIVIVFLSQFGGLQTVFFPTFWRDF